MTNRGGPVIGLEALSLQGIPVDDLILTRESDDNMKDLAGNAMACTVVGSCIAHSLVLAMKHNVFELPKEDSTRGEARALKASSNDDQSFCGEDKLIKSKATISTGAIVDLPGLIMEARRSARMCVCEGRSKVAPEVLTCVACGHTACMSCAGRPEHKYGGGAKKVTPSTRVIPSDFLTRLKRALPMVVLFDGVSREGLDGCKPAKGCDNATWAGWTAALQACLEGEFKFESCTRTEIWIVKYQGVLPSGREASLELHFDGEKRTQWLLWCKTIVVGEEANKNWVKEEALRAALKTPLARMTVDPQPQKGLLDGNWELNLPVHATGSATVTGKGAKTETWQRKIGLKNGWEGTERFSELRVEVDESGVGGDLGLDGAYELHPKCGTAQASLHSCEANGLHLFLDQSRNGASSEDFYVIADSHRRLGYGESRCEHVAFHTEWRAEKLSEKPTKVQFSIQGKWAPTPPEATIKLNEIEKHGSSVAVPVDQIKVDINEINPVTMLKAELPLSAGGELRHWPQRPEWRSLDLQRSKTTFDSFNWFMPLLTIPEAVQDWTTVPSINGDFAPDPRCAPPKPSLQWHRMSGNKLEPRENQLEAAQYEQALKGRPDAFVVQMRRDGDTGSLRVGVNPSSLIHRARSNLPGTSSHGEVSASWRVTEHSEMPLEKLPSFMFTSCKGNKPQEQPPNFQAYKLRPEQQRSLGWMLAQEASDGVFVEEEATEAVLAPLKWRAEARVARKTVARGGIVADQGSVLQSHLSSQFAATVEHSK